MKKVRLGWLNGLMVLALLPAMLQALPALAAPGFGDTGFENTWNRVDKPVQDLPGVGRGYTWGPPAPNAGNISTEPYNGAARKVQYFDKARMEINNPGGNPNDLFYVTTGLLVKELVTGNRQDGDSAFTALPPSQVQVAGDTNEGGANPLAPTYASFRFVGTFFEKENSVGKMSGQPITAWLERSGLVSSGLVPEQRLLKGYDEVTGHNIADVFEDYGNLNGPIWNGSAFVNGSVFFGLPLYVFGRPITEPYWVRTVVRGEMQDVLVQLFERRVLTYTPSNPDGFKVEMGNVGQHYYRWRYELNGLPAQTPNKAEFVSTFGHDNTGLKNPYYIAADSQGNFYVCEGVSNQIRKYNNQGQLINTLGQATPGVGQGQFNRITGLEVDQFGNLYVAEGGNYRVQKFDSQGRFLLQWSVVRHYANNNEPQSMTIDSKGTIYTSYQTGVEKFDNQGNLLLDWGVAGPLDSEFNAIQDIAVDSQGTYYILDIDPRSGSLPNSVVRKFDAEGHFLLKWGAGNFGTSAIAVDSQGNVVVDLIKFDPNGKDLGYIGQNLKPGINAPSYFNLTIDQSDNIFISGNYNSLVTKLDKTGKILANYSTYGRGDGQLRFPTSGAVDSAGNIYVYDSFNYRIQKFDQNGRFLLKWGSEGTGDGQFNNGGVNLAVDDQGSVYAVDPALRRVQKFDSQGNLLLKIGPGELETGCRGTFLEPRSVAVNSFGDIFVADVSNGTNCIQKFDRNGQFLLQWGGLGQQPGQFNGPEKIVVDRQGHFFVADMGNFRIQEFDAFGKFLQSWGSRDNKPGEFGPGPELTIDAQGNFYVLLLTNTTVQIGKYDSQGKFLYAWGSMGSDPGQLGYITGLIVDNQGNVYAVDAGNDRIDKFKQS